MYILTKASNLKGYRKNVDVKTLSDIEAIIREYKDDYWGYPTVVVDYNKRELIIADCGHTYLTKYYTGSSILINPKTENLDDIEKEVKREIGVRKVAPYIDINLNDRTIDIHED